MNRSIGTLSRALAASLSIGALGAICLSGPPAAAQVQPPPVEVIATLVPVYHEGHATYWYNGYWHYRDTHGAWAYYHEEPVFLRDWRGHHPAEWHHYGRR
jgi:hypothetical protein